MHVGIDGVRDEGVNSEPTVKAGCAEGAARKTIAR
jgi:hypothetical protein